MPISVEIEGKGSVAEFPDGTSQAVIDKVIKRDYFSKKESFMDRVAKASSAESDMMSNPANAEILRTVVGGGSAWIPAGIIKAAGIVSGQREGADELANVVQEKITGTPKTEVGKLAAQQISAPFERLSEKSQEYADIVYDKTGSPLLATATRVAGEALPFIAPVAVGKGLKAIKGAVKAPEIDLGKVSEKPTSITPDVSEELKASVPKEVKAESVKADVPKPETVSEKEPWQMTRENEVDPQSLNFTEELAKGKDTPAPEKVAPTQSKGQIHPDVEKDLQYVSKPAVPIRTLDELRDFDRAVSYLSSENKKTVGDIYKEYGFNVDINKGKVCGYDFVGTDNVYLKQKKIVEDAQELFKGKDTATTEKVAPTETSQGEIPLKQAEMPVEGKPAKAAVDINKDLIEKGFEGIPDRELARYNPIQKAEEVGKAQALVSDPDFFEMAKGNKPLPQDVHQQVLFNVAINEATKAGNIDMLMDLAKSPIAEQRSLAAQQLGASAWEKPTNNIVKTINEVKKARETKVTNPKIKEKIKTVLNEEVKKINLSKEELSWDRFLSKIEC